MRPFFVAALAVGTMTGRVAGVTYSGSLTYTPPWPANSSDGLYVGPSNLQWQGYNVTITWDVTDSDNSQPGYPWRYTYHFYHSGTQAGFSHMIIEVSDTFTAADLADVTGASVYSITSQKAGPGNPSMPADIYGIKFDPLSDGVTDWSVTFYSNRAPVWGDFYGRCGGRQGGINYAFNYNLTGGVEKGFLVNDVDPVAPPQSGSIDYHILRPDSVVPEPTAFALLTIGLVAVTRRR